MFRSRFATLAIMATLMLSLFSGITATSASAQAGQRCFRETNQCISGRFRQFWEQNGGLAVFGFPVSAAQNERNRDTGQTYLTQWFERNRFELHPENKAPYDVLLGRLSDDILRLRGIEWQRDAKLGQRQGCIFFAETGHNICNTEAPFKTFWQTNGLEFDGKRGVSFNESLALFGMPLTEPRMETNTSGDAVMTQWFERARFEFHPGKGVLLGLLGNETRTMSGPANLPTNAAWVRSGNQLTAASIEAPRYAIPQVGADPNPVFTVAPNGRMIAYRDMATTTPITNQLIVLDTASGARRMFPLDAKTILFGRVFSPDAQQLAFTVISEDYPTRYQLRVLDLRTNTITTILQGSNEPVPLPLTWNSAGLFATRIIYASDAPPQGLYQVDLQAKKLQTVTESQNLSAEISPNGQKAALVTGRLPFGQTPRAALSVLDRASGRQTTIVPEDQMIIGNVQWSPDGNKIVHTRVADYGQPITSVRVTNADGTGEQILRLEGGPFVGQLQDVAWLNNTTLLLLAGDQTNQLGVYEVSLSNFNPASAKFVQGMRAFGDNSHEFVYVPR